MEEEEEQDQTDQLVEFEPPPPFFRIEVIIFGDTCVGKSCVVRRLLTNQYNCSFQETLGAEMFKRRLELDDELTDVVIWDTPGGELCKGSASQFYKKCNAAFLIYDITNSRSLETVKYWLNELTKNGPEDLIICILGNKCDAENKRTISYDSGESLAKTHKCLFKEISAFTGTNIHQTFFDIFKMARIRKKNRMNDI